jgi:hypothetical protein
MADNGRLDVVRSSEMNGWRFKRSLATS